MTGPTILAFNGQSYSRPQLEALADGMAVTLERRGVRAGQRVALMSSNRPECIVAILAVWRLGAAVVLVSPAWRHDEVAHALTLTTPDHAVGDHPVLGALMPMVDLDEAITPGGGPYPQPAPESDAVLVFSSGTTGLPKAVRHTHGSFAAAVRQWGEALQLTSRDRIQIFTPLSHILGLLNVIAALNAGGWVRLHRRFDIDQMLGAIEADRITIETVVAPIALAIAAHPHLESFDLSSLRFIVWGATPVTESVAERVTSRVGVKWVPAYGASELPVIACNPLDNPRLDSVGPPVAGVEARVVSLHNGKRLSAGQTGEIQARSDSLMAGYLPSEDTAAALCDGWYRTGDIGYIDSNGWLRITDRLKEMIKVRGFQVAPAEIEAVLHGHPAVQDCAVFGIPDGIHGEAIVAAVSTTTSVDTDELIALVAERLATYKRLSRVEIVAEIPRLPSGKVLRRELKERYGRTSNT